MLTKLNHTDHWLRLALACLLLGLYLLVYIPQINSADGEAILAVTVSTLRHGVPDIGVMGASDALQPFDMSRMGTFGRDGAYYAKKGVTPSVALMPLVLIARSLPWLDARATAMLFNPLVTTATALCLYTFARWLAYKPRAAFALAMLYGVATFAITYVKTLFGEPLAALLLLGAVMAAYRYRQAPGWRALIVAGLCLGGLAGVNLVYMVFVPALGVYLFWGRRPSRQTVRDFIAYSLPLIALLALLGLYNWVRFGSPTNTGYHFAAGEGFTKPLLDGMYGLTFGSYRGLFWYNPVLLLAIPGWLLLRRKTPPLAWLILALTALQILAFAAWWSWDGGIVWGPRFLLTVIPLITLCLVPLVEAAWERRGVAGALVGLALLSIGIQLLGALYSFYPYIEYLFRHYYILELPGLAPEVQTNPGLSPILGHLALTVDRWPLEPVWAAHGVDGVHLAAALALIVLGIIIALYRARQATLPRTLRLMSLVATIVILISLNVVVARQGNREEMGAIRALESTLQPPGMVVVATTHFGETLIDVENGTWVVSTNAPTSPSDPLAAPMWDYAMGKGGNVWLLTWFAPGDPANWQERDLWTRGAFAYERAAAGHRALLFNLSPPPTPDRQAGYRFGVFNLEGYGVAQTGDGLLVTLEWSAEQDTAENFSWFVHVVDAAGNVLAQQDRQPAGGYNPTSTWDADETRVIDRLYFPSAKGDGLSLRVGWVNPLNGDLPPTFSPEDNPLPEGFVLLPVSE